MAQPLKNATPAPARAKYSLLNDIQQLEKGWDKVPLVEYGARLPDGTYLLKLAEVTVGKATREPNKGTQFVALRFEVSEGDLAGQSHTDIYMLKDTDTLGRLKARAKHLSINYQTLAELDAGLQSLIDNGNLYECTLVSQTNATGKTYQQFSILREVESPADREAAESLGNEIDQEAAQEAEQEPQVKNTAAKAPAPKGGRKPAPAIPVEDAQDLIGDLE